MSKSKLFRALYSAFLAVAVVVAAAFALPHAAHADTILVTNDMAGTDGIIRLADEDTDYVVTENLTHPILISSDCTLTFNEGTSLTISADTDADAISVISTISRVRPVTIKNATVIQNNPNRSALYMEKYYTTIENCSFTSAGATCVSSGEWGFLYFNSGSLSTTSTDNGPLISDTYEFIANGGSFAPSPNGYTLKKGIAAWATVNGGTFTNPDIATRLAEGKIFTKTTDGAWEAVDDTGTPEDACYKVVISQRTVAYFTDKAEAEAFQAKSGGRVDGITFEVTFDADGGSPEPETQDVVKGEKATEPATPYKKGFEFVEWLDYTFSTIEPFDFDTPITVAHQLVASYKTNTSTWTVTFHANGGTFSDGATEKTQTYVYADTVAAPDSPTKDSEYFDGWTTADGDAYDMDQPVTTNIDLYASWVGPAASCDGTSYGTLQEAFDAAQDGSTVVLLRDLELDPPDDTVNVKNVNNLTFDLAQHTLTILDFYQGTSYFWFEGCNNLVLKDGKIYSNNSFGVGLGGCKDFRLQNLDIKTTGAYYAAAVGAEDSTGTIESGTYFAQSRFGAVAFNECPSITIEGGTFTHATDSEEGKSELGDPAITFWCSDPETPCTLSIKGGTYSDYIEVVKVSGITLNCSITGGSFASTTNVYDVAEGYAMLARKANPGFYEVVPVADDGAPSDAIWAVTLTSVDDPDDSCVIYFEDKDEAETFAAQYVEDETVTTSLEKVRHKVTFKSQNKVVATKNVRAGKAIGTLPEGEKVPGYTFAGWYVGDTKVDASYTPTDDVVLVAMWYEDGSDAATLTPLPKTGDTTAVVAIGAIALVGVAALAAAKVVKAKK